MHGEDDIDHGLIKNMLKYWLIHARIQADFRACKRLTGRLRPSNPKIRIFRRGVSKPSGALAGSNNCQKPKLIISNFRWGSARMPNELYQPTNSYRKMS